MYESPGLLFPLMVAAVVAGLGVAAAAQEPPREGLRLWLDASDEKTVVTDADDAVQRWADKSGGGHDALPAPSKGSARRIKAAMNDRGVVRFEGAASLNVPAVRNEVGPAHVFIVSQRLAPQVSDASWQRLLSCWDGVSKNDNAPPGFTYTSGFVRSKKPVLYGYFEMRAKLLDASITSCFWLYENTPEAWTEIDIVEMPAGIPQRERHHTMNVHVFHVPGYRGANEQHWVGSGTWYSPFRFADDFHVYAAEWDREFIAWYVDGVPVRRIKNTHWHYPLFLNMNIESQQTFVENPMPERYPATFDIDYVRSWTKTP